MAVPNAPGAKKAEKKVKKPSTFKRKLQSDKKRIANRSYRASVLTSIRSFESSLSEKEAPESVKEKLNKVYSMMDKGVKHGVFKPQKAARTKSRLTARISK